MFQWVIHILGIDSVSDWPYAFWSGSGGKLVQAAPLLVLLRRFNCHQPRCWRVGKHPHGIYTYCHKHHPET